MYEEKIVLCGANSYDRKFYLNPDFEALPDSIVHGGRRRDSDIGI